MPVFVYLTTLLTGRLSPLCGYPVFVHILLPETDNQRKGENDCRKYFTINLHERM